MRFEAKRQRSVSKSSVTKTSPRSSIRKKTAMTSVFSPSWRGVHQTRQACSCRPCNHTDSRASSRSDWRAGNRLARRAGLRSFPPIALSTPLSPAQPDPATTSGACSPRTDAEVLWLRSWSSPHALTVTGSTWLR